MGEVLPLHHRSEPMGSLTWLFPMPATLIHSGLSPLPTIPKQNLFSATCKSDQIRQPSLSQTSRVLFLWHVVFGWGYAGLLTWIGMIQSWFWKSYFISWHGYWSLHSFGAALPAGPALFQFILLLLSICQEEEGGSSLLQEPQLLWGIRCMLLVSLCCYTCQLLKLEVSNLVCFKPRGKLKIETWQFKLLGWWKIVSGLHAVNTDTLTYDPPRSH